LSLLEPLTIGFGTEFISEKGRIESLIDFGFPLVANFKKTRNTWSVFGEAALKTTQFFNLIATIRHDDAENIQSTTARIAANLNFTKTNTSAWLIYGEGFKLPSLFALGHPLTGNPALKPERSENIEFRIEQTAFNKLAEFSFSVYRNKFSDLVDFDSNIFLHVNRSNVVTRGVDVELKLDKDLRLGGNISYLNADTGNSNVKLEHRPKWNGSVELSWKPTEALSVSARGVFNGRFFDSAIPTGLTQLGSYERLDANIQWAATQ
jgi:iron complex outermembrane receptor protein/vitamin B12 transporter